MFKQIDRMGIKVTNFCNLNCIYCHQLRADKDNADTFVYYDELKDFLSKANMAPRVAVTVAGGEISLKMNEFNRCVNELSSIGNAVYAPNIVTNGSNMKAVLQAVQKGIMRADAVTLSWDGLHSYSKTRKGKSDLYSDEYFNKNLKLIGQMGLGKQINIVFALTPYNIDTFYDSVMFALSAGIRNFTYYLIHEAKYQNKEFLVKFVEQLMKVADTFVRLYPTQDRFALYNFQSIATRNFLNADMVSSITCKKLGRTVHFDTNGDIYACLYFGDHRAFQLGNLLDGGIYMDRLEEFSKNYLAAPSCKYGECKSRQCFECPAANFVTTGSMQKKIENACNIRHLEQMVFADTMDKLSHHITEDDIHNFWVENEPGLADHMQVKKWEPDKVGLPVAFREAHRIPDKMIESENLGRVTTWL